MERAVSEDSQIKGEIIRNFFDDNITETYEKEACQAIKENTPVKENSEVNRNKAGKLLPAITLYHRGAATEQRRDENI